MWAKIKQLKVFETLGQDTRISSVDVFRGAAILWVVLFHFNFIIPSGTITVDCFFVISGLLVGGMLTKTFLSEQPVHFFRFVLQRGFKIWPSYYAFLIIGVPLCWLLYHEIAPKETLEWKYLPAYLFFYQNYTGSKFAYRIWSLCVEEHFYIMLPLLFIFVQRFFNHTRTLVVFVAALIPIGIVAKFLWFTYSNSKDTYAATHNRIDALAWGVLLTLVLHMWGEKLQRAKWLVWLTPISFGLLMVLMYMAEQGWHFYDQVVYHSVTPILFATMILGVYYRDFTRWTVLRIMAYYSYNWYIWHKVFGPFIAYHLGHGIVGIVVYLTTTFAAAVFFTVLVEEPFMARRKQVLDRLFPKRTS